MSSRSGLLAVGVAVVAGLILVHAEALQAQGIRRGTPEERRLQQEQMRNLPQLEAIGTVELVVPNGMKIVSDAKQVWFLVFSPETRVQITGKASADMLGRGTFISFVANVNQKTSRVEEKVDKVAIIVPSIQAQIGAVPEGGVADAPDAGAPAGKPRRGAGAGAKAGGGAPFGLNLGGDQPFGGGAAAAGGKASGKAKARGTTTESFEIKGQITSIKGGKITLSVPNQYFKSTLRIELAEDPEVTIEIERPFAQCPPLPTLVKAGDRVEARGRQVSENRGNVMDLRVMLGGAAAEDAENKEPGKARSKKAADSEEPGAKDAPKGRQKAGAKEKAKDAPADSEDEAPAKKKGSRKKTEKSEDKDQ